MLGSSPTGAIDDCKIVIWNTTKIYFENRGCCICGRKITDHWSSQIKLQDEISEKQKGTIEQLEINLTDLRHNLSVTEISLKNETHTRQQLEKELLNLTTVAKSDYYVLAVDDVDKGYLIPLEVIIKSGKGNLFLNVASMQTAVLVARGSAGAAVTLASIAGQGAKKWCTYHGYYKRRSYNRKDWCAKGKGSCCEKEWCCDISCSEARKAKSVRWGYR